MSDVFSLIEEEVDAKKFDSVDEGKGSRLSSLVRESLHLDDKISEAEKYLKDLKAQKKKVSRQDFPELMREMDMDSVTVGGNKVSVRQVVHARIDENNRDQAFEWLRSIGEGDIIKHDVTVSFNTGQDNLAGSVVEGLRQEYGLDPAQKTHVHPQTLKAWVRNRIESGQDIDFDTFGVFVGHETKITRT